MKKNIYIAYALWLCLVFIGGGGHRIYCGKFFSGFFQIILYWLGIWTTFILVGYIILGFWGIWWIADSFLTQNMVQNCNNIIQSEITLEEEQKVKNIERFYELYKEGKITKEEYEARKNVILK